MRIRDLFSKIRDLLSKIRDLFSTTRPKKQRVHLHPLHPLVWRLCISILGIMYQVKGWLLFCKNAFCYIFKPKKPKQFYKYIYLISSTIQYITYTHTSSWYARNIAKVLQFCYALSVSEEKKGCVIKSLNFYITSKQAYTSITI